MATPTIEWVDGRVRLIDQTLLPHSEEVIEVTSSEEMVDAIQRLAVRGAPAIGVAGAYGVALASRRYSVASSEFKEAVAALRRARPTAINLARMVDRASDRAPEGAEQILQEAHRIREEERQASLIMGELGADLVLDLVGDRAIRAMTICNTGGLATVERGTALSVIQTLHERGRLKEALPLETRPLLQGGRLTTWELQRMGAPFRLLVDGAGPFLLAQGLADAVLIGADRIAASGDTANKIGSFSLALGASHAEVPFIVVAPESTIDYDTSIGGEIAIEDRGSAEVVGFDGRLTAPAGTEAVNPAFDVTPAELITALVTERRVIRFDREETI